jgi:hypothetical protein
VWPLSSSFYLLALRSPLLYWWSPLLPLVAELALDYLVTDMQNVHVPDPVVFLIIVLVPEHADLRLIPTIARTYRGARRINRLRGGARRINRLRGGARRTRGACGGGLLACPESVPVSEVVRLCGRVNLDRLRAILGDVTKGNLHLIPTVARRGGGIARGGACGIHSARGACAGSIRRSRCTCRGGHRINRFRGAHVGGTRSACGCSRGIGRFRRTCGTRRIRGGIGRTRGGISRTRRAGSGAGGIGHSRGARARCGVGSSGGACVCGIRRTRCART